LRAVAICCLGCALCASTAHAQQASNPQWLDLPTSKQLLLPAPGNPQRVNSLPMSLAVSPDRRWVVSLNAGYGTFESGYMQSLAVLDTQTGAVRDFPEPRTLLDTSQAFFAGITFSSDGTKVYASIASSTDLTGDGHKKTGNGIAVYAFSKGVLTPEKFLSLPAVVLGPHRHSSLLSSDGHTLTPYPAAIAIVQGERDSILVAENLADRVVLIDAQTGLITRSFDLSVSENVPATYPIAVAATQDGKRAFVALWNASEVVELDLVNGAVIAPLCTAAG
jgi:DNA-binding beta-propeller fold protein YncE